MSETEKLILKTIIFYDIFNYPLTCTEIFKSLPKNETNNEYDYLAIRTTLNSTSLISCQNGYYFLTGREKIINTRFERYLIAEAKYKKRLRYIKLLSLLPNIEMIMVVNSLAYQNCPAANDIDLAIISKTGRIWTTRFFAAGILKLLRLRPRATKKKDQLCPSFFFAQDALDLENLKLDPKDIFTKYWVSQFYPVYFKNQAYHQFIEKNQWLKQKFPHLYPIFPPQKRLIQQGTFSKSIKKLFELLANLFPENFYKKFELNALPTNLKNIANQSTSVIISNQILKFHDNDIRDQVATKYYAKLSQIIN